MGKLVVTEFVSLDGVFEDPGGGTFEHAGWTFRFNRGPDGDQFKLDELKAADAQLLGRVTYEGFARAWPTLTDEVGFAELMNSMPKYVVSTTLTRADWNNSEVISGDLAAEVGKLKEKHKGDVLVAGSGRLVQALVREKLVDEFHLMVFPIVLGAGRRLFTEGTGSVTFTLVASRTVGPDGVTISTYAPQWAQGSSGPTTTSR
jgi:dihydrofolate reductase